MMKEYRVIWSKLIAKELADKLNDAALFGFGLVQCLTSGDDIYLIMERQRED